MKTNQVQMQMAGSLIQSIVGQAQNAQTDLAMRMAKVALTQNLQSPTNTASVNGQGSLVDFVG
ncbi:MAG: hypothetical protein O3B73_08440 [bacterium]|jgi:hypothetical protein|nr:hypothetical protein [bacterium]